MSDPIVAPDSETPRKSKSSFRFINSLVRGLRDADKVVKAVFSITVKGVLLFLTVTVFIFFIQELRDDRYVIQEINVPESFTQSGYSGPVIAKRISFKLSEIIEQTRQLEITSGYSTSASDVDLSVELVGVGVPIRGIIDLIGQAIGIDRKNRIQADVFMNGDKVTMLLKVSGQPPEVYSVPMDPNLETPVLALIAQSAERILKYTDDRTLQIYYSTYLIDGEKSIALAEYRLQKYQGDRKMEALVMADLGFGYMRLDKFEKAREKIREGLAIDSTVGRLYANLGTTYLMQNRFEEAQQQYKKAFAILDPSVEKMDLLKVNMNMGNIFSYRRQLDSASYYFGKVLAIDPRSTYALYNLGIAHFKAKKDTVRMLEYFDKALGFGLNVRLLEVDTDLDSIRSSEGIQKLIGKYKK